MTRDVHCDVEFPSELNRLGLFANAFRVVPEVGDECFLDFCVYSATEDKAQVVCRIRVSRNFIPVILERLDEELENLGGKKTTFVMRDGTLQTADGTLVLLTSEVES